MSSIHSLASSPADAPLLDDAQSVERIFEHLDKGTTDLGDTVWHEPVAHYHTQARFDAEIALMRRLPMAANYSYTKFSCTEMRIAPLSGQSLRE